MKTCSLPCLLSVSLGLHFAVVSATAAETKPVAPLYKGLVRHHWKITTKYELAQRYFDQGLTLLYNFNHAEAIRSFQAAAQLDPDCPMAQWGIAYAHGPNINAPMFPDAVKPAWEASQRSLALKARASELEQALIDALAKRYAEKPPEDRAPLDRAYADAMRAVANRYPDDNELQTFFAEALMDISPWRYWTPEKTLKPFAAEATATVERVLARTKGHLGADHLYIHLVEAGPSPERAEPSADRLGKMAPAAGHIVHMPSHIYLRVGRYHDATKLNAAAIEADEKFIRSQKPTGVYPGGYYPHNIHFYWNACDIEGRSRDAIRGARKLEQYTLDLRCGAIEGPRQRYLPLLAYARFGRWDELLREKEPLPEYLFDRAMWHHARGLAYVGLGNPHAAEGEFKKFTALEQDEKVRAMDNPYFPGTAILAIAHEVLAGKVAGAQRKPDAMLAHLRRAVELEDAMPYMEPAYWYYPARQSLGAALLRLSQTAEAEQIFRQDLKNLRENGRGLFGLEQSLRAQGRISEADEMKRRFAKAWRYADTKLDLAWF